METAAIVITGTPEAIAEGLQRFAKIHAPSRPEPDFQDERMTIAAAASYMDISYKTLCKRISDGKIRCHGTGRTRFVLRSELITDFKNLK